MDLKSNSPFWPTKDGLIRTYPRLDGDIVCDVAVLGGGITGALVAHHLAEAGVDTVVIDKRDIGWGSTSASTALLQYEIDTPLSELTDLLGEEHAARAYLACRDAIGKLERLASTLNEDVGFIRKRSLFLATKQRDVKLLRAEFDIRRKHGIRLDWLSESDVAARFPFTRPAALLSYDAAQVNPYRMAHALLAASHGRCLRVFDATTVVSIQQSEGGVLLMSARGAHIRAWKVVFASGYETQDYLKQKVAKLISTFAVVSEPFLPGALDVWGEDRCLIWEKADPYFYLRTTEDGRVLMGGEDVPFRNPAVRDRLIERKTAKLVEKFGELFPNTEFEVAFAWAGTFGQTKDGLAYIGESTEWQNAYFALGYGGNGITYSLLAAEIIRDAFLNQPNEHAQLFRFDR